jgi:hypothetical protein
MTIDEPGWGEKAMAWILKLVRPAVILGAALLPIVIPVAARADQNEATAVAIWFVEADGSAKPYYFHDPSHPMPRWSCDARLDYLTKKFFRMTRSNPDLKDKKAVKSACVAVRSIK